MRLVRPQRGRASLRYLDLIDHDKTGIVSAIKLINEGAGKEMEQISPATPFWEEIARSHEWVIEALLQGAFIREYHLWEKNVREYIAAQRNSNDAVGASKWHHDFIVGVEQSLATFGTQVPANTLKELRAIRRKVNKAKHEPGLTLDHFVSDDELFMALETYRMFWQCLSMQEVELTYWTGVKPRPI